MTVNAERISAAHDKLLVTHSLSASPLRICGKHDPQLYILAKPPVVIVARCPMIGTRMDSYKIFAGDATPSMGYSAGALANERAIYLWTRQASGDVANTGVLGRRTRTNRQALPGAACTRPAESSAKSLSVLWYGDRRGAAALR
eukprot:scaffold3920_cov262-Pinguiococcus_pyrenoidosus.AAC.4